MSELSQLSKYIVDLQLKDVPEKVQQATVLHVLDTVGTALGASQQEQIRRVSESWLKRDDTRSIHIWGQNCKAGVSTAVFLNAMMGHTQEMDDVHTKSKTHIGTVVIPAAWGLAEYLGKCGQDFILAVICGYETMSRIGMAFGVSSHRNKGWHVTATAGTFGAAVACAKLLGLDAEQTTYALGLAGAQSFGTWGFLGDGSTNKVLNPARAAQVGMEAAFLAQAGMTGPEHILTAEDGGILAMMSDESDPTKIVEDLGTVWQSLYMDNKPYPSCRSTHCTIDGTLALAKKYAIKAENVDHVEVDTYLVGYKQCGVSEGSVRPRKPVHAKFSSQYTVACALLFGEVTLRQFKQEVIDDPKVQELVSRVVIRPADEFTKVYPNHWGCTVRIYTKDGHEYEEYVKDASGSVDNPLTKEQVESKAIALMKEICGEKAKTIAEEILKIINLECMPEI